MASLARHDERRLAGLQEADPQIASLLEQELRRQRRQIELVASENYTWPAALAALGSVAALKLADGYPRHRETGGCEVIDEIEELARERVRLLFGAPHANVQPHSGAQANMAVYFACLRPGDTVLAMRPDHGGHHTHGLADNFSGRFYRFESYGVDRSSGLIDLDEVLRLAKRHRPRLIVCGASSYPRAIDPERFRAIADEVGALLLFDMAHLAGLIAAGLHPNPVPHADFITSTVHKTLAGPRCGGFILCTEERAAAIDRAVSPGVQSAPFANTIAAKAVCFAAASTDWFRAYQRRVRENADALAETLGQGGLELLTGGTDTHMLMVDLRGHALSGRAAERRLADIGITVNRYTAPYDPRPAGVTSCIRLGTPAVTMRGFTQADIRQAGALILEALRDDADVAALSARATALTGRHPLYPGTCGFPGPSETPE